ncbi:hypothetical protein ABZP36_007092 [Zizania latifolia]
MATKRSVGMLGEAGLRGKKVFVRINLNVPLEDAQKITDDTLIRASMPAIKFLLRNSAKGAWVYGICFCVNHLNCCNLVMIVPSWMSTSLAVNVQTREKVIVKLVLDSILHF